jgi:muramidase (phage lysozyme)
MIGRDPKWIAAQIGHVSPAFTFSVYQQVATRRYVDEQAIWALMRFADEPAERVPSRQITRTEAWYSQLEKGEFDGEIDRLNSEAAEND